MESKKSMNFTWEFTNKMTGLSIARNRSRRFVNNLRALGIIEEVINFKTILLNTDHLQSNRGTGKPTRNSTREENQYEELIQRVKKE